MDVRVTALMRFLEQRDSQYYGKALELREAIEGWLAYIPATFPHYTRHTVGHSDEIIFNASQLLFEEGDPGRPIMSELSSAEAYIIVASAYLHDAGMVASDSEKLEIMASDEWRAWTTDGGGAQRLRRIEELRATESIAANIRAFLADVQFRYLLAEFIRARHPARAARLIREHEQALGRFAFDDPLLQTTIADVCAAHGLRTFELEDPVRFPDRRTLRRELVNVRFLAIVLRLADLLDVSTDRACPLLLNAANPLPAESLAHWTRHQGLEQFLVAPDRVEIRATCKTQEEHRLWQDWCEKWLIEELKGVALMANRMRRHPTWRPPYASIRGGDPTIVIRPAADAQYIPSDWHLTLDEDLVIDRLVRDVSRGPVEIVRELLQNALDANRCQMYLDLEAAGESMPANPSHVDEQWRSRYPVVISFAVKTVKNEMSGEDELRQLLVIEDVGLGMDRDVIERYFLQVGRSYYQTEQFRKTFRFVPASRFGVGFLSVFGISDQVTVETFRPSSPTAEEGPLKMTLFGPRSYLLTTKGTRRRSGTRVEILLRRAIDPKTVLAGLHRVCRRVELPVRFDSPSLKVEIRAEKPDDFTYEVPDVLSDGSSFRVTAHPVSGHDVEGEIYVFSHVTRRGESWSHYRFARDTYPSRHPAAIRPGFPDGVLCINGLHLGHRPEPSGPGVSAQFDYRGRGAPLRITRSGPAFGWADDEAWGFEEDIRLKWNDILSRHLETSDYSTAPDGWKYRQRLAGDIPFPDYWDSRPDMIPVWMNSSQRLTSPHDMEAIQEFVVAMPAAGLGLRLSSEKLEENRALLGSLSANGAVLMSEAAIEELCHRQRSMLFQGRVPESVRWSAETLLVSWGQSATATSIGVELDRPVFETYLPDAACVGMRIHKTTDNVYSACILNSSHPLTQWLSILRSEAAQRTGADDKHVRQVMQLLLDPLTYEGHRVELLNDYLRRWAESPGVESRLLPPVISLGKEAFSLQAPARDESRPTEPPSAGDPPTG